jgi:hypothetical protein
MADEVEQAGLSKARGQTAAGMEAGPAQKEFVAAQGAGKMSTAELWAQNYRQRNLNAVADVGAHAGAQIHHDGDIHNERGQ